MNKEIKTKWIQALRSGKYKQGKGHLRGKYDDFCCLGVLCDIINPKGWIKNNNGPYGFGSQYNTNIPESFSYRAAVDLTIMNDGYDGASKSFHEIADWIESNIE